MKPENDEYSTRELIKSSTDITGSVVGTTVGILFAGPAGAVLGSVVGPLIAKSLKALAIEVFDRSLTRREIARSGTAYRFALEKIIENKENGIPFREDAFFAEGKNSRSAAAEVLEGIVMSAQREFEELKIQFLGYLYANICYNEDISKQHANQLIRTAQDLSYRQFCILKLLNDKRINEEMYVPKLRSFSHPNKIEQIDIIAEMRDLNQKGLLLVPTTLDGGDNSAPIKIDSIKITLSGMQLCKMLDLEKLNEDDIKELNEITQIII